jgi:hypothetical protein
MGNFQREGAIHDISKLSVLDVGKDFVTNSSKGAPQIVFDHGNLLLLVAYGGPA